MKTFSAIQPGEKRLREFDFEGAFTDENGSVYDSIGSVLDVTIIDAATEEDCTSTMYDNSTDVIDGCVLRTRINGNVDGHSYKITVTVEGSTFGEVVELEAIQPVAEV